MKKFQSTKIILILEEGDVEKMEKRNLGKGETIDFLFVPEKEKDIFKKSIVRVALLPCVSQNGGKVIYY